VPTTSPRPARRPVQVELLANLTLRELRGKFKRTTLGWAWSVVNPVLNLAVYATVFGVFLGLEPPDANDPNGLRSYPFFLVCALLPWTFHAAGLNGAAASFVANESLVKKVWFPRIVLPGAAVLAGLVTFGIELLVLSVALLIAGNMVLPWLPVVALVVLLQAAFVLGLGLVLASMNARFRDVSHFLTILLNVWFYATPILYPLGQVPERTTLLGVDLRPRELLQLNPMFEWVASYRDLLYDLQLPSARQWLVMTAWAALALLCGLAVHRRTEPRLAEIL
jgi:ABC-type polysaccharide/polyol phosphate export permease